MTVTRLLVLLSTVLVCTQWGCAGRRNCRTCSAPSCCAAAVEPSCCGPCGRVNGAPSRQPSATQDEAAEPGPAPTPPAVRRLPSAEQSEPFVPEAPAAEEGPMPEPGPPLPPPQSGAPRIWHYNTSLLRPME